jgi:hypothetical protein
MRFLGEILRDSGDEEEEVKGSTMFGQNGVVRPLDHACRLCRDNRV